MKFEGENDWGVRLVNRSLLEDDERDRFALTKICFHEILTYISIKEFGEEGSTALVLNE